MPTDKRQRKRDGHQARQVANAAARRRKQTQRTRAIAGAFLALVLVAGLAVVVSGGGSNSDPSTVSAGNSTTSTASAAAATTAPGSTKKPVDLPPAAAGASIKGDTPCPPADGSAPRTTTFDKPPPTCINPAKTYSAEMQTSKGLLVISLDAKGAPKTVNNFVVLARYHFFDGIAFHRIIPGFVIQGGDPLQTGLGGPGYKFEDELPKAGAYKVGSLAMANSGANTNGSQFFIVTGDAGASLPPSYSLFGQVTQGLDVVSAIDGVGIPGTQDGKPSEVVTIKSVTIKET
ncbi:MAG TPA: peptidylprolyl isomerase [Acidimicrobiales bacterium]|nr:peptidylprolyl isomerase [Acidimicrobiales bacterium]